VEAAAGPIKMIPVKREKKDACKLIPVKMIRKSERRKTR